MSKAKLIAGALIAVLGVVAAVQTYRVHELTLRLSSVSKSVSAPVPRTAAERTADAEREAGKAGKAGDDTGEMAAAKNAEALLKQERERAQQALLNKGHGGVQRDNANAPGAPSAGAVAASAANSAAKSPQDKNASDASEKKAAKDAQTDPKKDKTLIAGAVRSALNSAQSAAEKGSYDDAIAILRQGLEVDPTSRDLYRNLASLYSRLGQRDAELQTYADWSAHAPGEAPPHYDMARTYAAMGKGTEALQELSSFLNMTQGDLNAYPMAASVYRTLGMSSEEGTVLDAWRQQAPDALDARRVLADYYARTGDNQASLTEYQGIAQRLPEDADVHRNLSYAYRRLNMSQEAETEMGTAAALQPRNMSTQLQLAEMYRQSQKFDAALQTYAGVIAEAPNTPEGQQAQQSMVQLQRQIQPPAPAPR